MATARYSSIWDRWRGDQTNYTDAEWEAWLQVNYPDALTSDNNNKQSWLICPAMLAEVVWLYIRGEATGPQAIEYFSFSDHEVLQMLDVRDWILAAGNAAAQQQRFQDCQCWMSQVEQRGVENKSFIYTKMGIRDDSLSG